MDFLSLTNRVIDLSGLDLAQLTQSNFASPPDRMFIRLKNWVAEANRQMQKERPEYAPLVKEGVALVSPRFTFYDYNEMQAFPNGNGESATTEHQFSIAPAISAGNNEGYADITGVEGDAVSVDNPVNFNMKLGETLNFPPAPFVNTVVKFKRWGTYNLTDQNNTLDTLLTDVGSVHLTSMEYSVDSQSTADIRKICYVPYDSLDFPEYACFYGLPGQPRLFTKLPDGRFAFHPHPAYPIRTRFRYTEKVNELEAWDDEPTWLDEKWHEAIAYLAASYYGDYENPKVSQTCFRRYWNTKQQMERELSPVPSIQSIRMW